MMIDGSSIINQCKNINRFAENEFKMRTVVQKHAPEPLFLKYSQITNRLTENELKIHTVRQKMVLM